MMEDRIVVPGSWRPFVAAASSALLLSGLGAAAWRSAGATPLTVGLLGAAAVAAVVLVADLPRRTDVAPEGLVRRCLLRHETIAWSRVVAVERQRRRFTGPGTGGLVVRGRRGRWLLATSAEPPQVHAALARLMATHAPDVRLRAEPPATVTDR